MYIRSFYCLAAALALGCHAGDDYDRERCADVSAQIEQAVADYTDGGLLLPGAIACELTPDSFDPRATPASMEYLLDAFANACLAQSEACWGVEAEGAAPPPPAAPPSAPPAWWPGEPAIAP